MRVIIKSGAYGQRIGKRLHIVYRGQSCDVSPEEAERLVSIDAAEYADEVAETAVATPAEDADEADLSENAPEVENGAEDEETPYLDAEQLKKLTNAKLRELANDMGIDCEELRTKAQLIAAICNVPLESCIEDTEADDETDDGEQPPELSAEAPVV